MRKSREQYGSRLNLPVDDETWFDFTKVDEAANALKKKCNLNTKQPGPLGLPA